MNAPTDLNSDFERAEFLECGRAFETGIIALERQRFESWLAGVGYASSRCSEAPEADYACEETQAAWSAWQAIAALTGAAAQPWLDQPTTPGGGGGSENLPPAEEKYNEKADRLEPANPRVNEGA